MTELKTQDTRPKLVVMAGFPRSGKSRISKRLADRSCSPRIAFDDIRQMNFGKKYPSDVAAALNLHGRYSTTDEQEGIIQGTTLYMRNVYLASGLSPIIDSTATYNSMRRILFNTPPELQADKFLLVVEVDPEVLRKRIMSEENKRLGYSPELVDLWLEKWENPDNAGYETVVLPNNTPRDYARSLKKALKVLGKE